MSMETAGKIQDFYNSGPGILSAKMLRDGATIKITIDNKTTPSKEPKENSKSNPEHTEKQT